MRFYYYRLVMGDIEVAKKSKYVVVFWTNPETNDEEFIVLPQWASAESGGPDIAEGPFDTELEANDACIRRNQRLAGSAGRAVRECKLRRNGLKSKRDVSIGIIEHEIEDVVAPLVLKAPMSVVLNYGIGSSISWNFGSGKCSLSQERDNYALHRQLSPREASDFSKELHLIADTIRLNTESEAQVCRIFNNIGMAPVGSSVSENG